MSEKCMGIKGIQIGTKSILFAFNLASLVLKDSNSPAIVVNIQVDSGTETKKFKEVEAFNITFKDLGMRVTERTKTHTSGFQKRVEKKIKAYIETFHILQ